MYYYVIEPGKSGLSKGKIEKIKSVLIDLGISGEIVAASPARTTPELVEMGIAKGYSTIVAVGDEYHINRVAECLFEKNVALGIIPSDPNPKILKLINCDFDLRQICLCLKQRRLKEIDMGRIEPNRYFLTEAEIHENQPFDIIGQFDSFFIQTLITDLVVNNELYCYLTNNNEGGGLLQKTWSYLLGKEEKILDQSIFSSKVITIRTRKPVNVKIGGQIVSRTPLIVVLKTKALQIIVSRVKIQETKETE